MSIDARSNKAGETRYMVRVMCDGKRLNIGTFASREEAERAERDARQPRSRLCAKCKQRFRPTDDRRQRCDDCLKQAQADRAQRDDHWLYYCYDADDVLLYVGITSTGIKRFRRHGNMKSWWKQVEQIKISHFESRAEVEVAERLAIRDLKPKHNVKENVAQRLEQRWGDNVIAFPSWRRPAS